jgi:ubiquinone/menaquinone biosynthesis C-methylase UbiE
VILEHVKARQQATWASGDFSVIGTTLQIVGEDLCEAADVRAGSAVLDVACGDGNAALAAARRYCEVTGIDYVPALLARAAERVKAERFPVTLIEADAEHLPFEAARFDAVLSTFGAMFSADHARAASELLRVCKPGGVIALANWTPEGFLGDMFRVITKFVPPPPVAKSPIRWGSQVDLEELFGDAVTTKRVTKKIFNFRYRSTQHFLEVMWRYYGPTHKTFESLDATKQTELATELLALYGTHDRGGGRGMVIPAEYLEIVFEKKPTTSSAC